MTPLHRFAPLLLLALGLPHAVALADGQGAIGMRASLEEIHRDLEARITPGIEARRERDFAQRSLDATEAELRADDALIDRLRREAEAEHADRIAPHDAAAAQHAANRDLASAELESIRTAREAERAARAADLTSWEHRVRTARQEERIARDELRLAQEERRQVDRNPEANRSQRDLAAQRERIARRRVANQRDATIQAERQLRDARQRLDAWWATRQQADAARERIHLDNWDREEAARTREWEAREAIVTAAIDEALRELIAAERAQRQLRLDAARDATRTTYGDDANTLATIEAFLAQLRAALHGSGQLATARQAGEAATRACDATRPTGVLADTCPDLPPLLARIDDLATHEAAFAESRFYQHCIVSARAEQRGEVPPMEVSSDALALARTLGMDCGDATRHLAGQPTLTLRGGRYEGLDVLGEFRGLRALALDGVDLVQPDQLARLRHLRQLAILDPRSARLPARLPPELTELTLRGVSPQALPDSLWTHTTLEVLVLENVALSALPPLARMPALRALTIRGSDLRSIGQGELPPSIRTLDLRGNESLRDRSVRRTCRQLGLDDADCLH